MPEQHEGTITAIDPLNEGVVQITLRVMPPVAFAPGQSVILHLGNIARTYCVASAPERPSAIQLCIRRGRGEGSQAIEGLLVGDSLPVDGPSGGFLMPDDERRLVLIGGDTGIAPLRSMVLHLAASGDKRPVVVLQEAAEDGPLYEADLRPLSRAGRIVYEAGDIGSLIEKHRDEIAGSHVLVAGFEPFLAKVRTALGGDVTGLDIQFETYGESA